MTSPAPTATDAAHGTGASQPSPRKVATAAAVGATIEWYDFFLYGTAAGLVFDKLYFSQLDGTAAQMAAFATFAIGFVARPFGGLLFGHFGDRIGRKQMLIWTLVIMGVGTALIGLLPTYEQIGIWAPILLILLRVAQGIGVGGEYGGAVLLAVEFSPEHRRGFFGSFAHIGVPAGLLLASGAFALASRLPEEAFLSWGWRACFLASILLLGVGAWIRLSVMETPAFRTAREQRDLVNAPIVEAVKRQPTTILLAMGTRYIEGFSFNFYSVFLLAYAVKNTHLNQTQVLYAVMLGAAISIPMVLFTGRLSDRLGRRPVYLVGSIGGGLLAFPVAWLVGNGGLVGVVLSMVAGLGLVYGTVYGPLAAFWSELFDTRYRYSAISITYQLSGIFASGLTPLIAAWLVASNGGSLWLVAGYNVAIAVISTACAVVLPETRGRDLHEDLAPVETTDPRAGQRVPV